MSSYLSDDANLADLASRIKGDDRAVFNAYGHLRVEAAFNGRIFVVYKPTGLDKSGNHNPPEILTTLKVTDFWAAHEMGAEVLIEDMGTGEELRITHTPKRVFNYDLFIQVPPIMKMRWGARLSEGRITRSLAFALLIKSKNRSDFYSARNTYCETPNRFRDLYPNVDLELNFI